MTREGAKSTIVEWIEVFYNRQRLYSTLNYLSPVQFEERAEALQWATSAEGKFARSFMSWNQDLLSRDRTGQLACANEVKRLGVTLEILPGRKAVSGFCTLWVQPANQRQFLPIDKN